MDSYSPLEVTETIASSRLLLTLHVQIHISDVYCSSASCEQWNVLWSNKITAWNQNGQQIHVCFTCIPGYPDWVTKGNPAQRKFHLTHFHIMLDRSQSDFYFVPQEIQTDMATPLSMEIFGRIDFSLGRLITRVTKTPKPTKQHVTWAVELVRIFFHSLLWPWEPLSWRSLWNCSVGWHDFPPIWVHDFSFPIASSTQPEGYTMPSYYYAYKNTESRLNWKSFNP